MSSVALSALVALVASNAVLAQPDPTGTEPLAQKIIPFDQIPYQVDPNNGPGVRGTQSGYNRCNSTTENQSSLCQTAFVNSIDDWCVWAPPTGPTTIGETEHEEVAWCTKEGHGTRLIPAGTITGVQLLKAPSYVQVIAFFDQTKINLTPDDFGGELDPHGADLRGNPLGGLVYSTGFPISGKDNDNPIQANEWHNFIGGNHSCFKVCDPLDPLAAAYCYNRLDRVGISYVCPNQAQVGVFEVCDSENQDPVGQYTSDGQVVTYAQPPESLGPITSIPYTARIPASSNCVTYSSAQLFSGLPAATGVAAGPSATGSASATGKATGGSSGSATASRTGSAGSASATGGDSSSNGAGSVRGSALATVAGVVFAVAFFA